MNQELREQAKQDVEAAIYGRGDNPAEATCRYHAYAVEQRTLVRELASLMRELCADRSGMRGVVAVIRLQAEARKLLATIDQEKA
jgi:hypothetical protein